MNEESSTQESIPASTSAGGPRKGVILLVIAALAVAIVLAVKFMDKQQALDEAVVGSGEQSKDNGVLDLPMFAPKPDPATQDPQAANGMQQAGEAVPAHASSVTMSAAPTEPKTDRVLTRDFIRDLAATLAASYQPAGTRNNLSNRGVTTLTFKKLNMRYGTELTGLNVDEQDAALGRDQALSHLFSPIVLRLVFDIFSQPLLDELTAQGAAQQREFAKGSTYVKHSVSSAQVREMLKLYASLVADAGKAFEAFASRPDLTTALNRYFDASARVNAAYGKYSDREAVEAPQKELDAISLEIKNAIQAREKMRIGLLKGIRLGSGSMLAESDAIDIASWIHRRLAADPDAINAVGAIASLAREFSAKLAETTYSPEG
ncbi:hypothetical protein [Desulfovibrio ferrophilus]|uniref:DNA/RNA helicase, superfamily I n=1 Tax=Desulfovibrio ferrophilus TaxID=241368 RepID=A0A2Z6B3R7_9BACT|nr:hypothetical protein [Desulfovibrio ferrophilus]BBD10060.1 DNA/RNA helicase, superfamily I [Desulfovibrio ferrophilus]